jgi:hypothetical protein
MSLIYIPAIVDLSARCHFISGSTGLNVDPRGLSRSMIMLTPEVDNITHNVLLLYIWCRKIHPWLGGSKTLVAYHR